MTTPDLPPLPEPFRDEGFPYYLPSQMHEYARVAAVAIAERDAEIERLRGNVDMLGRSLNAAIDLCNQRHERANRAEADLREAVARLHELVELKDIRDRTGTTLSERMDYSRRKPVAWATARTFLSRMKERSHV